MNDFSVALISAFWLGILTSISPCPLATNIAAVSYIGRSITSSWKVFFSGLLYTVGRMVVYMGLGMILVGSLLSAPKISLFLQMYTNKLLGPILIVVGMILLELIRINFSGFGVGKRLERWIDALGLGGAFLLGAIFALSFCPVSAALFFGSLIPIAVTSQSNFIIPSTYGVSTGLPVLIFAMLFTFGVQKFTPIFDKIEKFEKWGRRLTGIIFILVGIYYSLNYIFGVFN